MIPSSYARATAASVALSINADEVLTNDVLFRCHRMVVIVCQRLDAT